MSSSNQHNGLKNSIQSIKTNALAESPAIPNSGRVIAASQDITQYWKQVIEFTELMLQAAQQEEWENLAQLEEKRRKLLFTQGAVLPSNAVDRGSIRKIIQAILNTDQQILILCHAGQKVLAEKIHSLHVGQRALRAYDL